MNLSAVGTRRLARSDLAIAAAVAALTFILYSEALGGWWLNDDPQILVHAIEHGPHEVLFGPAAWRLLSTSNFTPLVTLSFRFDHALAGAQPYVFYVHQLASLGAAMALLYLLLRRYVTVLPAVAGTALVLAMPPVWMVSRALMVRHYVEGLALALAALLVWDHLSGAWERTERRRSLFVASAAVLYLAACLAKEVYLPLPLLFAAQSAARRVPWRAAARDLLGPLGMAILAVLWRGAMLGSAGGYGSSMSSLTILGLPRDLLRSASPDGGVIVPLMLAAIALAGVFAAGSRRGVVIAFVIALFAFVPLVPVAAQLEWRHAFVPVVAAIAAATVALGRRAALAAGISFSAAAVGIVIAGDDARELVRRAERKTVAEGRYVSDASSAAPPLLAESAGWYLTGLAELRQINGRGSGPRFILSREGAALQSGKRLVTIDAMTLRPRALSAEEQRAILALVARRNPALPVSGSFVRFPDAIAWQLDPPAGRWKILTLPHLEAYEVSARGRRRIPAPAGVEVVQVWRDTPAGWNVSPPVRLLRGRRAAVSSAAAGGKLNLRH